MSGSKVRANASKHKAMSYARMAEKERQLAQEVHHLLTQAEATDREEDTQYGRDRRGDELPEELRRRQTRLRQIREAKRALEARAKAAVPDVPTAEVKPAPKAQCNFTDPGSRIMKGPDGFVQAYNAQVAVAAESQLMVGKAVTQEANDKRQLRRMIEMVVAQSAERPTQVLAESRYCSAETLRYAATHQVDAYVATGRFRHVNPVRLCPRGRSVARPRHAAST